MIPRQDFTHLETPFLTSTGLYTIVKMPSLMNGVYNAVFRRNYIFLGTVFVGAFAMEIAFDTATNKVWDTINKGRQWKDIRHKYIESE
ncbi:qcr9 subunit 9 of the ubiquinol cytochrome-c reductase complex [Acarospora aff. strigata]|nr:qcr9 subunit 9 of the ubiquinol cytochrome-c reductase complex [Acarospora aff. strigata]